MEFQFCYVHVWKNSLSTTGEKQSGSQAGIDQFSSELQEISLQHATWLVFNELTRVIT